MTLQSRFVKGNLAPTLVECTDVPTSIVFGSIPQAFIGGQYIRNGPNPHLPMEDVGYHWFDGDGMLHGIQFPVSSPPTYTNKFILTPKYITEKVTGQQAQFLIGRTLTGSLVSTLSSIALATTVKSVMGNDHYTTANTALSYQNGRLLATMEADLPVWVSSPSLDSVGLHDFDGQLVGPVNQFNKVTAHPKVDRETGEVVFFCIHRIQSSN